MVFCVQGELAFSTAKIRDQVLANLQQKVTGQSMWDGVTLAAEPVEAGPHGIRVEVRFRDRVPQLDLVTSSQAFMVGTRAPRPGSALRWHDCFHDEPGKPCVALSTREW